MDLYTYLLNTYGHNEPIFTQDISFKDYSRPWMYKELNRLCEKREIIRYDKGVYYIPKETPLGKSLLDPQKVIAKKYVRNGNTVTGYYSGNNLLNLLSLSAQVPGSIEIYTNNEKSKRREIKVGKLNVTLRRARTEISSENVSALQLLELMSFTDAGFFDEDRRQKIDRFIKENGITRDMITKYAPDFPDKAMRNLVESEVIYSVA